MAALIEGIGDDVMALLFVMFIVLIVIMSWLSTNVRDMMVPANLLVIERRSRRLYTASFNAASSSAGNSSSSRLSPSLTTTTTTTTTTQEAAAAAAAAGNSADQSSSVLVSSSTFAEPARRRSNELELVNEIVEQALVEQALVDNLLEGGFYSTEEIDLMPSNGSGSTAGADSPIASGSGEVIASVRNTFSRAHSLEESTEDSGVTTTTTAQRSVQETAATPILSSESAQLAEPINILIKFVNEKEMRIQARPSDSILLIKKTHFSQEISSNKIVRFIYQGQFLNDTMTIKSLNIKDQTTIHCHIISKPTVGAAPSPSGLNSSTTTTTGANGDATTTLTSSGSSVAAGSTVTTVTSTAGNALRQRLNHRTGLARLQTSPIETSATTTLNSDSSNPANVAAATVTTGQSNPAAAVPSRGRRVLTSIDVNSLLLPLLAIVLAACWYFRVNFKHFFSPLSTLVLIILTFIYALFLFNNIHATSTLVANNFVITSRILQSRRRVVTVANEAAAVQQPPLQTVTTQAPATAAPE